MFKSITYRIGVTFLLFFALLVGAYISTSNVLVHQENDAMLINLAGMQRARSQKLTKLLLLYNSISEENFESVETYNEARSEKAGRIQRTVTIFDQTLNALHEGGEVPIGSNPTNVTSRNVWTAPVPSDEVNQAFGHVVAIWDPFQMNVLEILEAGGNDQEAMNYVIQNDVELVGSIHRAVEIMQKESEHRVSLLRRILLTILALGGLASIIGILIIRFSVTKPLNQLVKTAEKMSTGDLEHALAVKGSKEVEELSIAFERVRLSLVNMVAAMETEEEGFDDLDDDLSILDKKPVTKQNQSTILEHQNNNFSDNDLNDIDAEFDDL